MVVTNSLRAGAQSKSYRTPIYMVSSINPQERERVTQTSAGHTDIIRPELRGLVCGRLDDPQTKCTSLS